LDVVLGVANGKIVTADLLACGADYLNGSDGEFLLDVPPADNGGSGWGGVLAVSVAAGRAVALRIADPGQAYLDGASGSYQPLLPEHAGLFAVVRDGQVVAVEVEHCGWRFWRPPTLSIDPAAGGSGVHIAIGLAQMSYAAQFVDNDGPMILGGVLMGALGKFHFASGGARGRTDDFKALAESGGSEVMA
jgi:hypothetical protein